METHTYDTVSSNNTTSWSDSLPTETSCCILLSFPVEILAKITTSIPAFEAISLFKTCKKLYTPIRSLYEISEKVNSTYSQYPALTRFAFLRKSSVKFHRDKCKFYRQFITVLSIKMEVLFCVFCCESIDGRCYILLREEHLQTWYTGIRKRTRKQHPI